MHGITRWLNGITNSVDMSWSKLSVMVKDREAWHATVHGGGKESNTTGQQWVTEQQQINYRAICFSFVKNIMDIFIEIALICRFLWYEYFSKIISSNLKTQHIFPFLCIVFNFFHQCFTVFKVCLSSLWLNSFLGILYFLFDCRWNLSP